jgi:acetyl esterase/lipase
MARNLPLGIVSKRRTALDKGAQVVYALPEMDRVEVSRDLTYKQAAGTELRMDVYHPPHRRPDELRPAVVFVHGDGPPDALAGAKGWGQYVSWGQLAAASGLVAVTFDHRSTERLTRLADAAADVDDLFAHVREQGGALGIDRDALCLWTCSAGAPMALRSVLSAPQPWLRCVVALYALLDLQHLDQCQDLAPGITGENLREYSPIHYLSLGAGSIPPVFVARAGRDQPRFNDAIDRFVAEAVGRNLPLDLANHPAGRHAFDVRDDNARSRYIIRSTLAFMVAHTQP